MSNYRQVVNITACNAEIPISRIERTIARLNSRTKGLLETIARFEGNRAEVETDDPCNSPLPNIFHTRKRGIPKPRHDSENSEDVSDATEVEDSPTQRRATSRLSSAMDKQSATSDLIRLVSHPNDKGRTVSTTLRVSDGSAVAVHWPQEPLYVVYIHRTARDFLEQEHFW